MNCLICNSESFEKVFKYVQSDKYEEWVGITDVVRTWNRCVKCGFYQQSRNYELEVLEKIYKNGYRDPKFRGRTIQEEFVRLMEMPFEVSENRKRVAWVLDTIGSPPGSLLDIGSGLGVFPAMFKEFNTTIWCVEENVTSIEFIDKELGLLCKSEIPEGVDFELVSLVHVLEHIQEPEGFLQKVRKTIKPDGHLFIEVPDAIEFKYLHKDNDEFNSCHTHFYTINHLWQLLDRNGFNPTDVKQIHHEDRNLTRIMMLCQKQ